MATYKGQITLINVEDGTIGIGISNTEVFYITSFNGLVPPDLEDVDLVTETGDILNFSDTGATFHIKDGKLWATQEGNEVRLAIDANYITGVTGWDNEILEAPAGAYLWSKTIFTYTDNTQTVIYNYSKQGNDGNLYQINTAQEEILKFIEDNDFKFSPTILEFNIIKNDTIEGTSVIENLDLNKVELKIYSSNLNQWLSLSKSFTFEEEVIELLELRNNTFYYNLNLIKELFSSQPEQPEYLLNFSEVTLKIEYNLVIGNNTHSLQKFIQCRYAMNEDMAKLSLNAADITASIQNTNLKFSADGLEVQNGAFSIVDKNYYIAYITEEEYIPGKYYIYQNGIYALYNGDYNSNYTYYTLTEKKNLYADNSGNLVLSGNLDAAGGTFSGTLQGVDGTFSGKLEAASGTFTGTLSGADGNFSGEITAEKGRIGGFTIQDGKLVSDATGTEGPMISLDGISGQAIAENIILGQGAIIKDYINLGNNVQLRNPTEEDSNFITVEQDSKTVIQLNSQGKMLVGDTSSQIVIDGALGKIYTKGYNDEINEGWSISKDFSVFNNITVRGSIEASVMKYGTTQAVGGMLIIRPSSRIIEIKDEYVVIEDNQGFGINDWCLINKQYYQIINIDGSKLYFNQINQNWNNMPIINFGNNGNLIGVGINGSSDNSLITPQSISVFEFNPTDKNLNTKIILGKIPITSNKQFGAYEGSYGLYAENVVLKGSLVTQFAEENTYSGISTLYNNQSATSIKHFGEDGGHILIWAGAPSVDKIDEAPFYVDKKGNVFANKGHFSGSIISNSVIEASVLKAAVIEGWNVEDKTAAALTIKDAVHGIHFLKNEEKIFTLDENEIRANVQQILLNGVKINPDSSIFIPEQETEYGNLLSKDGLIYSRLIDEGYQELSSIKFDNQSINFKPIGADFNAVQINKDLTEINTSVYIKEEINYSDFMKYVPLVDKTDVIVGYNLYID